MEPAIDLRPLRSGDEAFLFGLFFQARCGSFAPLGWPEAQLQAFLRSQFDLQQAHYRRSFPGLDSSVITVDGADAGRVDVDWGGEALHVVDIVLSPAFQSRGIGSRVLDRFIQQAEARRLPVDLHVEVENPAQRLYRRLGFEARGGDGLYLFLVRPAGSSASAEGPS